MKPLLLPLAVAASLALSPRLASGSDVGAGYKGVRYTEVTTGEALMPETLVLKGCPAFEYCTHAIRETREAVCVPEILVPDAGDYPPPSCERGFCSPDPEGDPHHGGADPRGERLRRFYAVVRSTREDTYLHADPDGDDCGLRSRTTSTPVIGETLPQGDVLDALCQQQMRAGPLPGTRNDTFTWSFVDCRSLQHMPELF